MALAGSGDTVYRVTTLFVDAGAVVEVEAPETSSQSALAFAAIERLLRMLTKHERRALAELLHRGGQ